jgi:hypothetical protein
MGIANVYVRHIADPDRNLLANHNDRVADFFQSLRAAKPPDKIFLPPLGDKTGRGIFIRLFHGPQKLINGDPVRGQPFRLGNHLILFGIATDGNDLGNARDRQKATPDYPVGDRLQLSSIVAI